MTLFRLSAVPVVSALALAVACSNYASREQATVTSPDPVAASGASGNATSGTMAATLDSAATMQFGLVDVGGPKNPPHPSIHSNDTIVPGTVVIDAGGSVDFKAVAAHQVAVYKEGLGPADVNTTTNLVANPCGAPPPSIGPDPTTQLAYFTGCGTRTHTQTFDEPGEYLVICSVLPHFQIKMYGWVRVRARH
jgi:plastocyanin